MQKIRNAVKGAGRGRGIGVHGKPAFSVGGRARKKLGQHFLADEKVLELEAQSADVTGRRVLEIGAGDGRLTAMLLRLGAAHITACEIDPRLVKSLRRKFPRRVKVVEGDFLAFDESERFERVVGNIPYYITSPILLKLSRMDFSKAVLCLQKEVAERLLANPSSGNYGRLSVTTQLLFKIKMLAFVGRDSFSPKPRVDSCIVSLERRGISLGPKIERAIGAVFCHRKKSVKNAVVDAREELFGSKDKHAAAGIAQTLKYSGRKVFTLSAGEALELAEELAQRM